MAARRDKDPGRRARQTLGWLAVALGRVALGLVRDPRVGKRKWRLGQLLRTVLTGLVVGKHGLGEVEQMTEELGAAACKLLGIRGRVPDTTLRDVLVRLEPTELRAALHQVVLQARKSKQLVHDLPLRVASLDGKHTSTWRFDDPGAETKYGQLQEARAIVRTITASLVSVPARPCIDAYPIAPELSEMSAFEGALMALIGAYGSRFAEVIMYDSGAASEENAALVVAQGLDYVLCLTANQPTLEAEAKRMLAHDRLPKPAAKSYDTVGGKVVTRRLWLTNRIAGANGWRHLRTALRVEVETYDKVTEETTVESRYYLSSLEHDRLDPDEWLTMLRRRWAVENECHNTFDRIFEEDRRPWIRHPAGMIVMILLRRIAYTLMALYRAVTLRSESNRWIPWKELMRRLDVALLRATEDLIAGLRQRAAALLPAEEANGA